MQTPESAVARVWQWLERETLHPLYAMVLKQPSEDFGEEQAGRVALPAAVIGIDVYVQIDVPRFDPAIDERLATIVERARHAEF